MQRECPRVGIHNDTYPTRCAPGLLTAPPADPTLQKAKQDAEAKGYAVITSHDEKWPKPRKRETLRVLGNIEPDEDSYLAKRIKQSGVGGDLLVMDTYEKEEVGPKKRAENRAKSTWHSEQI
jgi:hypothetical protein